MYSNSCEATTDPNSTWDFSATTTTTADNKAKDTPEIDNNPWSLNRGKPKKKNTSFSFAALDEDEKEKEPDHLAEKKEDNAFDFGFTSVNKKDKKKKKNTFGDFEEPKEEPAPTPAVEEPAADDDWGGWGTAKTKKKGKKVVEPDPPKAEETKVVEPAPAEDEWAFGGSKKDKKKKGKNATIEVSNIRMWIISRFVKFETEIVTVLVLFAYLSWVLECGHET
jgi:hypothetical protein